MEIKNIINNHTKKKYYGISETIYPAEEPYSLYLHELHQNLYLCDSYCFSIIKIEILKALKACSCFDTGIIEFPHLTFIFLQQ